ncbi:MAG: phosphoenolpyruvate synthase [Nanoarchaeota archaeon]
MVKKEVNEKSVDFVKWFSEMSNKDVAIAGGKGASLAEMSNHKFPIPPGFVITAQAYSYFIEKSGIANKIKEILSDIDIEDTKKLDEKAKEIKELIVSAEMPEEMQEEIIEAYEILDVDRPNAGRVKKGALDILKSAHEKPFVAVRSSATTEDLADASFAGQQESFLNIKGNQQLLSSVKKCLASLFNARAIYYRIKKGFSPDAAQLAVVVQKMIDSDKSGVIFSKNPTSDKGEIVIEAVWGLGEGIVSGAIKPDHYEVDPDLDKFKIKKEDISIKKTAVVRNSSGETISIKLTEERAKQQVLNSFEIKMLSQYAKNLEEHYKKPQDIEFAIEGKEIYIVQSRPITTSFSASVKKDISGKVLLTGLGASPGIGTGIVKIIHNLSEQEKIKKGDVLVTEMTNPDMVVSMQKAAAIITDEGGITSHAAIVSREMGIPCIVGTNEATTTLQDGTYVTVDGNAGKVYEGKGETKIVEVNPIVPTKTKIKVIVDLPDFAERAAKSKAKSVGLVRLEGIIAESGKHPFYFVKNKKMSDYVKLLEKGLKRIAEHFEEIWVRTSDIRSDEYEHLQGAPQLHEGNPMLGDHGIRFSLKHRDIIESEIEAMKKVAEHYPDKIIGIMTPQVINVEEFIKTKEIANKIKIPDNVKIGIMVETPAAVQIINQLCEAGIEFISFGTNDLTQYILAIDRNNAEVQDLYNELNPAVLSALSYVIRRCKKYGVETSICGQAGSKEEMVKFLLSEGIDSISVNADAAEKVSKLVAEIESKGKVQEIKTNVSYEKSILKKEDLKKNEEELKKPPKPGMEKSIMDKDIEQILLDELDNGEESANYVPGDEKNKKDIPPLNDAIPIDSRLVEETSKEKEKEIDLS